MANDKMEVVVRVDTTVNDALQEMAQTLYLQTGLRIESAVFNWKDIPAVDKPRWKLRNVTVTSTGGPL